MASPSEIRIPFAAIASWFWVRRSRWQHGITAKSTPRAMQRSTMRSVRCVHAWHATTHTSAEAPPPAKKASSAAGSVLWKSPVSKDTAHEAAAEATAAEAAAAEAAAAATATGGFKSAGEGAASEPSVGSSSAPLSPAVARSGTRGAAPARRASQGAHAAQSCSKEPGWWRSRTSASEARPKATKRQPRRPCDPQQSMSSLRRPRSFSAFLKKASDS